jgi:hypothetical protein
MVYRDCYVTFGGSYYSVPHRLVGQQVWLRAGARTVQLYTEEHELIAIHDRASKPGERQTHLDHLPPTKVAGVVLSRESVLLQAQAIGPRATAVVQQLLDHRPEDRLRSAGRVVRLAETYGATRLEQACARAHHYGEADYPAIKRILEAALDAVPLAEPSAPAPAPARFTFVRQASDFVAQLWGGTR